MDGWPSLCKWENDALRNDVCLRQMMQFFRNHDAAACGGHVP